MKNIIIAVLVLIVAILFASLRGMSNRAAYWLERCYAAERVIDRCEEDCEDYFLDVLMEGDEYNDWIILKD